MPNGRWKESTGSCPPATVRLKLRLHSQSPKTLTKGQKDTTCTAAWLLSKFNVVAITGADIAAT